MDLRHGKQQTKQRGLDNQPMKQTESGQNWEYALALELAKMLTPTKRIADGTKTAKLESAFSSLADETQSALLAASPKAVRFLKENDNRLRNAQSVLLQSNSKGRVGDVRDIIVSAGNNAIGISAKHKHKAIKHSRLSNKIDFGKEWYQNPCSSNYWEEVQAVFDNLNRRKGQKWSRLEDKEQTIYQPLLAAFLREIKRGANPTEMMRYLLGTEDFYKVIKETKTLEIQSFNIQGSNKWGKKIKMPSSIIQAIPKEANRTTIIITMDQGWQLSFRLHNASSKIEPSLKFDIQLIGIPQNLARHEIPL